MLYSAWWTFSSSCYQLLLELILSSKRTRDWCGENCALNWEMEENQASLRVWIWRKPFFFWDRRDANTWRRRAIRVMRQLQPWIVEPKIRMTGRGLRMSSQRSLFEHLALSSRMVGSPSLSQWLRENETAVNLLAAGTENISLAEYFHFSLVSTKSTFSSCFELLQSVRMLINGGDSLSKFQWTERTTDIHLRLWRNNK